MILISSWSRLCPTLWSQVLSREWRCSWSSADRRCSNYIWVIDNLIAHYSASYIRDLTVIQLFFLLGGMMSGSMLMTIFADVIFMGPVFKELKALLGYDIPDFLIKTGQTRFKKIQPSTEMCSQTDQKTINCGFNRISEIILTIS